MLEKKTMVQSLEKSRKAQGLTQSELAELAGLSNAQNWSNVVHGRRHISLNAINRVAEALGSRFEVVYLTAGETLEF